MTGKEIENLEPGPETDALVAEKVMGLVRGKDFGEWPEHDWYRTEAGEIDYAFWEDEYENKAGPLCQRCGYEHPDVRWGSPLNPRVPCRVFPPEYSKDICEAAKVLERLRSEGYTIDISIYPDPIACKDNWCRYTVATGNIGSARVPSYAYAEGDNLLLAIAKVALMTRLPDEPTN